MLLDGSSCPRLPRGRLFGEMVRGKIAEPPSWLLSILAAGRAVDSIPDPIRGWERHGLLSEPRNLKNGYHEFGLREIGRLRVKFCSIMRAR